VAAGLFELRKDAITGWWVATVVDRAFHRDRFARAADAIDDGGDCQNCRLPEGDGVRLRILKDFAFHVVGTEEEAASGEGEDRVRDQRAGPVVGHLAAALDPDHLDPAADELRRRREDMRGIGLSPEREDRRVLEEQEPIVDQPVGALSGEALLEPPRLAIGHPAEPDGFERTGFGSLDRGLRGVGEAGRSCERFHVGTIAGEASRPVGGA
jgi:hypothetical protein